MNTEVMFSSKAMDWATPQAFFDQLDSEFHFTLDPCADQSNHKCTNYFTVEDNGLKQPWGGADGLLQSAIWQGYQRLGEEMLRRGKAAQHNRSAADPSTNGHCIFSRLHLPKA